MTSFRRGLSFLLAALAIGTTLCAPRLALCADRPLPRRVLVLYDGSEAHIDGQHNLFAAGLALPANYLGLLPEYRDVRERPLPTDTAMRGVVGVVTVFGDSRMNAPDEYLAWLLRQQRKGIKTVVLQQLGALTTPDDDDADPELLKAVWAGLGLRRLGKASDDIRHISYGSIRSREMDFERPLPPLPPYYDEMKPDPQTGGDLDVWLTIQKTDLQDSESVAVCTGAGGAFALSGYINWDDNLSGANQWYLDPFAFLRRGLGVENYPALTPTTLNGMRVAISHIDADGFGGFTELDEHANCADIIRDRILKTYDYPITVSVITAQIDPQAKGSEHRVEQARSIFRLDNVEPASHAFSHPFYWVAGDEKKRRQYAEEGLTQYGVIVPGYTFDVMAETVGSCDYITRELAPKGKPCKVMLWSGDCEPAEDALKAVNDAGILNMNGGDSVYDTLHRSWFSVSALYRSVGPYTQVFTGQANENILTNLWTGPYYGFRHIIQTMKNTEQPRRLMPIDIYYHFYSAEKPASISALTEVYDWALKQPTARMFTSSYIRMVDDFVKARFAVDERGRLVVENYGHCLSVRLPADSGRTVSIAGSRNVLGFVHEKNGLFVHLRPGAKRAAIALVPEGEGASADVPRLRTATGWVRDWKAAPDAMRFIYEGWSTGRVVLAGLKANAEYFVRADGDGWSPSTARSVRTDVAGVLTLDGLTSGAVEIRR